MKKMFLAAVIAASMLMSGCMTRIETGETGLRINASKQVEGTELMPGSWNQTLWGSVITFPTKDIVVKVENANPLSADNSKLSDFDMTIVYGINPSSVAELYSTKSKSFHRLEDGDTLLMYEYMQVLANNAATKVVRGYNSLEVGDNRAKMEAEILKTVNDQLTLEKLNTSVTLNVVQIRSAIPNQAILDSATAYVKAQNDLKIKQTEVEIAKKESERMAALSSNSTQSIAYMNAQAALNISEGIKNGKVQTIVVPSNMTGLMIGK